MNSASPIRRIRHALQLMLLLTAVVAPSMLAAQVAPTSSGARGSLRTRAELESSAQSAQAAGRGADAAALRARLAEGDFVVGDRVVLSLRIDSLVHDTLLVREGPVLRIPNLVDVPLQGVLRSELEARVRQELSRVIRAPNAEAYGLVRVAVLGEVTRPGYYYVTADMVLSDAIMVAGGPTGSAQPERSTIRRAGATLLDQDDVRSAIQLGSTIDALGLRAGDEIVVAKRRDRMGSVQMAATLIGVVGTIVTAATLLSQ